jgi:hypothetical protein
MSNEKRLTPEQASLVAAFIPTVGAGDIAERLNAEFAKRQGHAPAIELATEEAKPVTMNTLSFVPFEGGEVLRYHPVEGKPDLFALLVRESKDGIESTLKQIGSARGQAVAQMIVDGVNFLFACKDAEQRLALDAQSKKIKDQMDAIAEHNCAAAEGQMEVPKGQPGLRIHKPV